MGKLKAFIFNKEEITGILITGILNELYADLSNEIEFEDFLKVSSFYCLILSFIGPIVALFLSSSSKIHVSS